VLEKFKKQTIIVTLCEDAMELSMQKLSSGLFLFVFLLSTASIAQERYPWEDPCQWDVPYVPTPLEVVDRMLEIAKVGSNDILYDLGCGDGRIVIRAASFFGTKGTGIDIDPERIEECHINAEDSKVENLVTFLNQDLFETDFRKATVVTLYLLSSVNLELRPKLLQDLKPGARIVSHDFGMGDWKTDQREEMRADGRVHLIHYWIVPANVSGKWKLKASADLVDKLTELDLYQSFQKVNGKAKIGDQSVFLHDTYLEGVKITFTLTENSPYQAKKWVFEGRVQGHRMGGTVAVETSNGIKRVNWRAERDPKTMKPLDSNTQYALK
jgi:SAM-dependent methyltransferase